ncbi:MAG TPA: ECF-type sigma factor [Acidobacteriaceae bacterium]
MAAESRELLDERFSLVYEELRRVAAGVLRDERNGRITPTTLVHEAWMKLARSPAVAETSALHFRRIAARAMRQVLVEAARRRNALRRADGEWLVTFDETLAGSKHAFEAKDVLALDDALEKLSAISARQAALVEARFYGGFEIKELAELFEISEATVAREWRMARAWLAVEVQRTLNPGV